MKISPNHLVTTLWIFVVLVIGRQSDPVSVCPRWWCRRRALRTERCCSGMPLLKKIQKVWSGIRMNQDRFAKCKESFEIPWWYSNMIDSTFLVFRSSKLAFGSMPFATGLRSFPWMLNDADLMAKISPGSQGYIEVEDPRLDLSSFGDLKRVSLPKPLRKVEPVRPFAFKAWFWCLAAPPSSTIGCLIIWMLVFR